MTIPQALLVMPIDDLYYNIACYYRSDIEALQANKKGEDLLFTGENKKVPLERAWLTNRINTLLKEASKKYHKKISSHTFRIGHVNALISEFGLETVQKLINHENIQTTACYKRNVINDNTVLKGLKKVAKLKETKFPRHKESLLTPISESLQEKVNT